MRRFMFTGTLALLLCLPGGVAAATPPANDNFVDAIPITSLPFDATVDLTDASGEPGEESSTCFQSTRSVWYRYQPASPHILSISIEGASPDAGLRVFLDFGGGPFLSWCAYSLAPAFDISVSPGSTLYFQVASDAGTTGALHLSSKPLLTVSATIESTVTLDRATGTAFISGTITCNKAARGDVFVTVSQRQGRRVEFAQGGMSGIPCGPTPTPWTAQLFGSLVAGSAGVSWVYGAFGEAPPFESAQGSGVSGTVRVKAR